MVYTANRVNLVRLISIYNIKSHWLLLCGHVGRLWQTQDIDLQINKIAVMAFQYGTSIGVVSARLQTSRFAVYIYLYRARYMLSEMRNKMQIVQFLFALYMYMLYPYITSYVIGCYLSRRHSGKHKALIK